MSFRQPNYINLTLLLTHYVRVCFTKKLSKGIATPVWKKECAYSTYNNLSLLYVFYSLQNGFFFTIWLPLSIEFVLLTIKMRVLRQSRYQLGSVHRKIFQSTQFG